MSILVDFYAGAYGPTLCIVPAELAELASIQLLFAGLGSGEESAADFMRALSCASSSVGALELRVSTKEPSKTFTQRGSNRLGPELWWSNTREGWQDCADLAEALIQWNKPGHQYLSKDGDDAVIELCFRETL